MDQSTDTTPKRGAPKKDQSQRNKEFIQTFIWLQYLFKTTDTTDTNRLVEAIDEGKPNRFKWNLNEFESVKANFRGYRNHKTSSPGKSIIDAADLALPGSKEVYESHNLSNAIITDDIESYFKETLETGQSPFKEVSINFCNNFLDRDLKKVLDYSAKLLKEYHDNNTCNHLFNSSDLSLQLLGNLTILLRFFIKRSQYTDNNWRIEDIAAILINIIETDAIKKHLKLPAKEKQEPNYEIRDFYLKWLYETLEIQIMLTEEQFLSDPKDYLRLKLEEVIEDQHEMDATALELANLIEKKSIVWLPNEDFINEQLHKLKQSSFFNWRKFFVLKHASVEKSVPMKLFNQGIQLISILAMLLFSVFTLVFIAKTTLSMAVFSLLCLMMSALLYKDVTKNTKRNIFT